MRNLLMLLVAVLGTSVMVHAFPVKDSKATSTKETTMTKHPKHKKAKTEKKSAEAGTASSSTKK